MTKDFTNKTCQVGLLDSTNPFTPKTALKSKHLLNTALDKIISYSERKNIDLHIFEEVLNQLAIFDPRQSQIVEFKFFGGLSTEEIAKILGISPTKVSMEWQIAKMWIYSEIKKRTITL
ncbi:MAG: hypothetical protein HY819_14110 [Acidobacteria bacterium]|nr:hypothetical protein [Acidobacteriota bacterium]